MPVCRRSMQNRCVVQHWWCSSGMDVAGPLAGMHRPAVLPACRRYLCNKTQIGQFLGCSFMQKNYTCNFRKGCSVDDTTLPPTGSEVACVPDFWLTMPNFKRVAFMQQVGPPAGCQGHVRCLQLREGLRSAWHRVCGVQCCGQQAY